MKVFSSTMCIIVLMFIVGAVSSARDFESKLFRNLKVMASISEPFVIFDSKTSTLKGLDVDIINNFAKKYNLAVEFVIANESLNEAFYDKNSSGDGIIRYILDA